MALVKLHSGYLSPDALEHNGEYLEKDALLVYTGTHISAEGPVEVSEEHLERLAANHNARIKKAALINGGKIQPKDCPPIQLDHSPLADVTVGRVWGPVQVGETEIDVSAPDEPIRLEKRKALFARTRFLGAENIEKVKDGRWVHGSIGADFDAGKFNEFTVTPFPAAENARMLSAVKFSGELSSGSSGYTHRDKLKKLAERMGCEGVKLSKGDSVAELSNGIKRWIYKAGQIAIDDDSGLYYATVSTQSYEGDIDDNGRPTYAPHGVKTKEAAERAIDKYVASRKLSKGESMDKEKLKKHLTEQRKLSDQDANLRMAAMSEKELSELSAEVDEHEKKLAAEAEEKARLAAEAEEKQKADEKLAAEKAEEEKKKLAAEEEKKKEEEGKKELAARKAQDSKLAAAKEGFTKLAKGLVKTIFDSKLEARKANIGIRLSKLRTEAKLTPAEQKGIDISKLAAKSDDAIESFFEAFDRREQVIPVGQYGSTRAESAVKLAAKVAKSASMKERLSNMPFTSKALSKTKGTGDAELSSTALSEETTVKHDSEEEEKQLSACLAFLSEGKKDEASKCLREYFTKCRGGHMAGEMNPETESHLSALAESNKKLHNQLEEIVKLVGPVLGIKLEDLN